MFSRLVGGQQTEKASQDQVSDKAAAGVTALAKLVRTVGADSGFQVRLDDQIASVSSRLYEYTMHNALYAGCGSSLP